VALPFLAGAVHGTDAGRNAGATVAPPFLAGAMQINRRRLESWPHPDGSHEGKPRRDSMPRTRPAAQAASSSRRILAFVADVHREGFAEEHVLNLARQGRSAGAFAQFGGKGAPGLARAGEVAGLGFDNDHRRLAQWVVADSTRAER